jgi:hypothetical protein
VPNRVALIEVTRRVQELSAPVGETNVDGAHGLLAFCLDPAQWLGLAAVKARGGGSVFLEGTCLRRHQTSFRGRLHFRGGATVALAYDDGPKRIALEAHHHPQLIAMGYEVSSFRETGHVVDLDGIAEAKGDALPLTHSAWRMPGVCGTKREAEACLARSSEKPLAYAPLMLARSSTPRSSARGIGTRIVQKAQRLRSRSSIRQRHDLCPENRALSRACHGLAPRRGERSHRPGPSGPASIMRETQLRRRGHRQEPTPGQTEVGVDPSSKAALPCRLLPRALARKTVASHEQRLLTAAEVADASRSQRRPSSIGSRLARL